MKRRQLAQTLLTLTAAPTLAGLARHAQAQSGPWPNRPIKLIVPVGPGGVADILAREFAQQLTERLGQPVVVDNRPGAATVIGTTAVAKAPPDGYTLLLALTGLIQNPVQMKSVPYDPIKDFTPIARIGPTATILAVRSGLGPTTAAEFVRAARGKRWAFSSTAPGPQVIMEIFNKTQGLGMTHVAYKSEPAALTDLLNGEVQTGLFSVAATKGHIQAGKITPLAVLAPARIPALPQVPTFVEQGFKEISWTGGWYAFMAPAGLPPEIAERLTREVKAIYDDPKVNRKMVDMEIILNWADGKTFAPLIQRDMDLWRELVRQSGVTFE